MRPRYNCQAIIKDIQSTVFMPQKEMAVKLCVCQQSISHWLIGVSRPWSKKLPALLKLAEDTGLDISKYETNSDFDMISEYLKKNKYRELVRLFELYGRMSRTNKQKFVRYAEKMGK